MLFKNVISSSEASTLAGQMFLLIIHLLCFHYYASLMELNQAESGFKVTAETVLTVRD